MSEKISELEEEIKQHDVSRKPVEISRNKAKAKHETARGELKGIQVRIARR